MEKIKGLLNVKHAFDFEDYYELRNLILLSKEQEIKRINAALEKVKQEYENSRFENDIFRAEIETKKSELEILKIENQELATKLEKIKASKNNKRIPGRDEEKLKAFSKFLEDSLKSEVLSHRHLRREIECWLKNASDRDVLFFLLQVTIMYKRGMAILTEAQIREGVISGLRIWTEGTDLHRNTISLSLERLKSQGFIMRHRHNKHKSVFFINVEKSREIYNKLESKEYSFDHIVYMIDVEMIKNKKPFSCLCIERTNPELLRYMARKLKAQARDIKCTGPVQLEFAEITGNSNTQNLSTAPINDPINDSMNDIQTNKKEECTSGSFSESNSTGQSLAENPEPELEQISVERQEKLQALLHIWSLDNKMITSLTQIANPDFYVKIEALKKKINWSTKGMSNSNNYKDGLLSCFEQFPERIRETAKLLKIEIRISDIHDMVGELFNYIDEFLA